MARIWEGEATGRESGDRAYIHCVCRCVLTAQSLRIVGMNTMRKERERERVESLHTTQS